jgi:hypothetical protein
MPSRSSPSEKCSWVAMHTSWRSTAPGISRLLWCAALPALLMASGCRKDSGASHKPGRRVLALTYEPMPSDRSLVHYFPDTSVPSGFIGKVGQFTGALEVVVIASNSRAWQLEFRAHGQSQTDTSTAWTNQLWCLYPAVTRTNLPGLFEIVAWFLSDAELLEYDKRYSTIR